ncbi:MAG TPA: cell division protein ZapA [Elusimicrobiales bacterium]|nr:cell division protein ZapA [Elusimicrobiales bacterium]
MSNNDFEERVRNRTIQFPGVDGVTILELQGIVRQVVEKMDKIEERLDIADSSKIAILAAYEFAVELYNLRQQTETNRAADSKKVEDLISKLERSVAGK